ncbi:MAG: hypothetical protein EA377_01935 [Phycisphaerales bacterium]|nr:MAG: hypothetical protein EA377_01935 [Phycisphaerales bacterium]
MLPVVLILAMMPAAAMVAFSDSPSSEHCPADLTGDDQVNVFDLLELLSQWGPCSETCPADLTGDDQVNVFDLLELLAAWGSCPPPNEPEIGACCQGPNACDMVTSDVCDDLGGEFFGNDSSCEKLSCPLLPQQCPQGVIDENELCGEDLTGGCNSDIPSFGTLCCGDVLTGNTWAHDGVRDTDWFRFTLDEQRTIRLRLTPDFAEPELELFLFSDDCESPVSLGLPVVKDGESYIQACLEAGSYLAVVAPAETSGLPCPGGSYTLSLNCSSGGCEDGLACQTGTEVEVGGPTVTLDTGLGVPMTQDACFEPPPSPARWYRVVGNGEFLGASTCGSSVADTEMHVFCGTCSVPNCVRGATDDTDFGNCGSFDQASAVWCSEEGEVYYIAVYGAEDEGEIDLNVQSFGPCFEPPSCELLGVCQGLCGTESPLGCWCDEACTFVGDCCPGRCEDCDFFPSCVDCPSVSCNDNIGEACGESINAGCAANPPEFTFAGCGTIRCGQLWAEGNDRDEDWFNFNVSGSQSRQVSINVNADFPTGIPVEVAIYDGECGSLTEIISTIGQCSVNLVTCLDPGQYKVVIRPGNFFGMFCSTGPHRYLASFSCLSDCQLGENPCDGFCGGQSPLGCWCDPNCFAQGNCCDNVCESCPDMTGCAPPTGTCSGWCGFQSADGCWCDLACQANEDCCPDFCEECASFGDC